VRGIATDDLCGNPCSLENGSQPSGLCRGVGVAGDVQDEERRNALVRRDVAHGGEIAMLLGVIAELLSMTVGWQWQVVNPGARFGHLDDGGDVEGVGIHGHAPLDHRQGEALRLRILIVRAHQRGELTACRVAHDQQSGWIASVRRDVLMYPAERGCNVAGQGTHVDGGQQAVVDGHEYEPGLHEGLWLDADHALITRLPAATVNPEDHRQILRALGRIHIQHLPLVRRRIRDIPGHTLGVCVRDASDGDEEEAGKVFHRVHATSAFLSARH
jgi:hypothetical protein